MKTEPLTRQKLLLLLAPSIGLMICPPLAWAGAQITTGSSTCTTLDCGGLTLTGNYVYEQPFTQSLPFTVELFSGANECLRMTVSSQNIDTQATLVSPDGQVWQNDDGNGNNRPRIVARTTTKGWYTLHMANYTGAGPGGQFTFKYGRYPITNPNCSSPSATVAAPPRRVKNTLISF